MITLKPGVKLPVQSEWRTRFEDWVDYWNNTDRYGPNYTRNLAGAAAGLFQAEPPGYQPSIEGPAVSEAELAEVTTEAVKLAAGQSVAFLRPTRVAEGEWVFSVLSAERVEFRFAHRRLVEAVIWRTWKQDPENDRSPVWVLTEHYTRNEDGTFAVESQAWEGTTVQDRHNGVQLGDPIDVAELEGLPGDLVDSIGTSEDRELFGYVWEWDAGRPVPIYVTNEWPLDFLSELHGKERGDAGLPETVLVMPQQTITANRVRQGDTGQTMPGGFSTGKNVLGVEGDDLAQKGAESFVNSVHIPQTMTTRERILSVRNEFYEECGVSPASLGLRNEQGSLFAESGASKTADQQTTMTTITGPARRWNGLLQAAVDHVAGLESGESGTVVITEGLKQTPQETADFVNTARAGDGMSIDTAVKTIQPHLEGDELSDEVDRVKAETLTVPPPEF